MSGLRRNHLVLDRVSQKLGVRADVQGLHHAIFVKSDCAGFHVDNTGHLLHRQAFGKQL